MVKKKIIRPIASLRSLFQMIQVRMVRTAEGLKDKCEIRRLTGDQLTFTHCHPDDEHALRDMQLSRGCDGGEIFDSLPFIL
jgi:hypothetical protein